MWHFQQIRTIALENLPYSSVKKSPVEKVALAFQYDIKRWLLPGLNQLAQRPEPINVEDVQLLGLEVALKIAEVRESFTFGSSIPEDPPNKSEAPRAPPRPGSVGHIAPRKARNASKVDFTPIIQEIFELYGTEYDDDPFVFSTIKWQPGLKRNLK